MRPDSCITTNEVNLRKREKNGRQPRFVLHASAQAQAAQRKHKIRLAVFHCRLRLGVVVFSFISFHFFHGSEFLLTLYDQMTEISAMTTINQILLSGFLIFSSQASKVKTTPIAILYFVIARGTQFFFESSLSLKSAQTIP